MAEQQTQTEKVKGIVKGTLSLEELEELYWEQYETIKPITEDE